MYYFKTENDVVQKQGINGVFFVSFTVRRSFHRMDFSWKKYGSTGLSSKKTEALYGASKERKQPPVVTLQQAIFYNIFSLCL